MSTRDEARRVTLKDHADMEQEPAWEMVREVEQLIDLRKSIRADREQLLRLENEADFLRNRIYLARREFDAIVNSMRVER